GSYPQTAWRNALTVSTVGDLAVKSFGFAGGNGSTAGNTGPMPKLRAGAAGGAGAAGTGCAIASGATTASAAARSGEARFFKRNPSGEYRHVHCRRGPFRARA